MFGIARPVFGMEESGMTKMRRISRLILELEPLAYLYERNGTDLFKVCSELLTEYRNIKKGLLADWHPRLELSDVYRRTWTGTFVGNREALLVMAPDQDW